MKSQARLSGEEKSYYNGTLKYSRDEINANEKYFDYDKIFKDRDIYQSQLIRYPESCATKFYQSMSFDQRSMYNNHYNNDEDNCCGMPFDAHVHQIDRSQFIDKNSRRNYLQKTYKVVNLTMLLFFP